jgi:hypothetical protein
MWRTRYLLTGVALLLACIGIGVGCLFTAGHTVEVARLRGPCDVEVHAGGRLVGERAIAPGSPEERAVADWLAAHNSGWSRSIVSYAPGRLVRGAGFTLNLLPGGRCVLNYEPAGGGSWVQVERQASETEVDALAAALRPE